MECNYASIGCQDTPTRTVWAPTMPEAERGPVILCDRHFKTTERSRNAAGWLQGEEATAGFSLCSFVLRGQGTYRAMLTTLFRRGTLLAGLELGQPHGPADRAVYSYNGHLWLVLFDMVVLLGEYKAASARYKTLLDRPKVFVNRKQMSAYI